MKGLTTTLLILCAVICTYAQFDRSYRNGPSWPPTVSGSSEEVDISSDERHPTSVEASKGDLGVPESFEAEDREFTYYPVAEKVNGIGNVFYEVIDEIRTERGGNKKKSKKGKCKKKSKKKKGKKKSKSKGCGAHGGWWYVWDKKHGYISGRWGDPPIKGLEKEHFDHQFGHGGHNFGGGYDGHGKMKKGGHGGGGHHGGGHHGGGGGGGGGGGAAGGWGWKKKVEHYPHGWAEKKKEGWGWGH